MTAKPMYFHVRIAMSVQIAMRGSESQSWGEPRRGRDLRGSPFTAPFVASMRLNPVPTMTSAITYGTKMRTRITD